MLGNGSVAVDIQYSTVISLNQWKTLINQVLPTFKLTYVARGSSSKFEKIWGPWTELSYK